MKDVEVIDGTDVSSYELLYSRDDTKQQWRCKSWMRPGRIYSQQANERLGLYVNVHEEDYEEEEDMEVGKKRRRYSENRCRCCSEEDQEFLRKKKTKKLDKRDNRKFSEIKETEENYSFKMREMKLKRKKKEAEKLVIQLMKDMRVYEIEFNKLFDELDEKKKQVVVAEGKVKEYEFIKSMLEDEDCEYDNICYQLKERVGHLEKGLANACRREKRAQQRIRELEYTKTQLDKGLQDRIRELECANARAESEIEFWKRMFKDLETRVLVEPQALSKVLEEPRRVCSQGSYAEEQKKNVSRQVKEESLNFDGKGRAQGNEDSMAKQTDVRELADVDFVSHSLAKESGQLNLSENGKNTEIPPTKVQIETSCAASGTCSASAPSKIKEEGLNCDLGENALASILLSLSQESRVSELAVSEGINNGTKIGNSYEKPSTVVISTSCMKDEPNLVDTKIIQLNSGAHCRSDFALFL